MLVPYQGFLCVLRNICQRWMKNIRPHFHIAFTNASVSLYTFRHKLPNTEAMPRSLVVSGETDSSYNLTPPSRRNSQPSCALPHFGVPHFGFPCFSPWTRTGVVPVFKPFKWFFIRLPHSSSLASATRVTRELPESDMMQR